MVGRDELQEIIVRGVMSILSCKVVNKKKRRRNRWSILKFDSLLTFVYQYPRIFIISPVELG